MSEYVPKIFEEGEEITRRRLKNQKVSSNTYNIIFDNRSAIIYSEEDESFFKADLSSRTIGDVLEEYERNSYNNIDKLDNGEVEDSVEETKDHLEELKSSNLRNLEI